MYKDIRVIFMGTPSFSVPVLEKLIEETNVVLVVTQPDKEVGRKKELSISPVKELAIEKNIPVFQPLKIRKDFEMIRELKPDIIITCAYGQIVSQELLNIPPCGCINIHASLLPKLRGSAPIQWAILNGDQFTGVTLMYMDATMDTGDMIAKEEVVIHMAEFFPSLYNRLSLVGRDLLMDNFKSIIDKTCKREKQNEEDATYAPMIKREDELINLNSSGKSIINKIRALNNTAYIILNNQEIKVLMASFNEIKTSKLPGSIYEVTKDKLSICVSDGVLFLEKVKPMGKKEMDIKSYLNGINKDKITCGE
ncbi:MAG: methionyl-tRNA formyltransferase [Bacilli bacterium]